MPESSWYQQALEDAVQESNGVDDRIGLARLAILERLVSPASDDPSHEDALFEALDALRAIEREHLSNAEQAVSVG